MLQPLRTRPNFPISASPKRNLPAGRSWRQWTRLSVSFSFGFVAGNTRTPICVLDITSLPHPNIRVPPRNKCADMRNNSAESAQKVRTKADKRAARWIQVGLADRLGSRTRCPYRRLRSINCAISCRRRRSLCRSLARNHHQANMNRIWPTRTRTRTQMKGLTVIRITCPDLGWLSLAPASRRRRVPSVCHAP